MTIETTSHAQRVPPIHPDQTVAGQALRLRAMEMRLGRKIRVLHIGNIANNAFHNAKLLLKAGIECDVLCYDYYHMMGCPEWEDADFDGDIGNDFRPNWAGVNLNGYQRPRWFVQGPLGLCMDYLEARLGVGGERDSEQQLWGQLLIHNGYARAAAENGDWSHSISRSANRLGGSWGRIARFALQPHRVNEQAMLIKAALNSNLLRANRIVRALVVPVARVVLTFLRTIAFALSISITKLTLLSRSMFGRDPALRYVRTLIAEFARDFPSRKDQLDQTDFLPYQLQLDRWQRLLRRYDVVQGFSTDPIWPMLAGVPYFAFEHGTLREIPARETPVGRLTTLAYHKAQHVFVTNADCMSTAVELAGSRAEYINHPYDEDDAANVTGWQEKRRELCTKLDANFLIFQPTRHDWVQGTGYADKANDVFLRAFAGLRREGLRVGLVLCAWGRNINESQALLRDLGVDRHVLWERPMPMRKFFRTALACGMVADQFKLGAVGGVSFKALAAGVPVCTRLDVGGAEATFGAAPPVINCATTEDLLRELPPLVTSPERIMALGEASKNWFRRYHGGSLVVASHLSAYLDLLEGDHATGPDLFPRIPST